MDNDSSSYFGSEEFKEVLTQYEKARENGLSPYFDSDQLTDISEYYSTKGKYKKAYEAIEYALYIHPENTNALVVKAHLLIEQNNIGEAKKVAETIQDHSDYEVKLLKAELLLLEKKMPEAEVMLCECLDAEENEKDCYADIAYLYLDNEFPQEGLSWFQKALKRFPDDTEIMEGLAEAYFEADMPEKAIECYNSLLDKNPYSADYWIELGKIYFTGEEFNKSIEAYEFATAIDRENKHALLMLGHCYTKLENFQKAEEYYKLFSLETDNSGNSNYYLGICYASMGEYQKAIDSFLKGIKADGELFFQPTDVYSYISSCQTELGDKKEAIYYIDLAIREDPEYAETYYSKAQILLKFGDIEEALEMFHCIMDKFSSDIPIIMEIGIIFTKYEKYEWAISTFQSLKTVYPLAYHIFLSFIYNITGDNNKYREHMDEVLNSSSQSFIEKLNDTSGEENIAQIKKILLDMYGKETL